MKFIPYGKQWITEEDVRSVNEVLQSDFLTQGPKVKEFENEMCRVTESKYCVAVANGTAALHISVAALEIEKGSEGITSPITFAASANCMAYNYITPRFCDIDSKTYTMNPEKLSESITEQTKLVIPVHLAGQPANMYAINRIAYKKNLYIIEDAAHAIGSNYADGSPVGNCKYSDMTIFSFHPVKTITTGEGGAITTNSKEIYEKLLLLRSHGITKDPGKMSKNDGPWYYEMQNIGFNYRLTDMQAALGLSQLKKLPQYKARRREITDTYNNYFEPVEWLTTPYEAEGVNSCFHLYIVLINFKSIGKNRTEVMNYLRDIGIGTQVHYIPVYMQPYYRNNYSTSEKQFPNSEAYYQMALSLPLYPKMSDNDVNYVIESVKGIVDV